MNEGVALSQLADILPPPAPSGVDWILLFVVGLVCLAALAALLWFVKKRYSRRNKLPAREALSKLTALRSAWQARTISDREAAYRLAALLRLGLALPQLAPQLRPAVVDNEQSWRETLAQLNALRYRDQPSSDLRPQCFERAERWLAAAQREAR